MILDFRFLAGVALGATLGLMISPQGAEKAGIDLQAIKRTIPGIGSSPPEPVKQADCPTNERAKRELFRFSMWDFETFGPKSMIRVTRCINIDARSLACEMRANLSWITEEKTIEGVFQTSAEGWHMIAAKTMRKDATPRVRILTDRTFMNLKD
ncbi:hypothetical protein [Rhizobium sp. PDO1-076]|uniref:hypothetical protein n=1 Tax=Rhizobium sp. PDO1-076 TaxID=1125979 RepID=UPI00068C3515|nr:hypothetical protein [Rhizobium sp. PDO1-076]